MDKEGLIIGFFEGRLNKDEQLIFDNLLKTDSDFADQVAFEKELQSALHLNARKVLKSQLQGYEAAIPTPSTRLHKSRIWLYVAASIALLVGVFTFTKTTADASALYAEYFEPYPNLIAPIVRNAEIEGDEAKAFVAYESKNYKTAAIEFEKISASGREYGTFYQAISLMETANHEAAKELLISTNWSETYVEKAAWYLALNHLALNEKNDAKIRLQKIINEQEYNWEKATLLLEKIK